MKKERTYRSYLSYGLSILALLVFGFFNTSGHLISTGKVLPDRTELLKEKQTPQKKNQKAFALTHFSDSNELVANPSFYVQIIYYQNLTDLRFQHQTEHHQKFSSSLRFQQLQRTSKYSDESSKV